MSSKQRESGRYRGGSLRLPGYDYTQAGAYAVTIRTRRAQASFGEVVDGRMRLNSHERVAQNCCEEIPIHFAHARLDTCVIMPDHVHVIIILRDQPQRFARETHGGGEQFGHPVRGSLPTIIRSFKSAVTKGVNELRGSPGGSVWQRGYYEHIIRDQRELNEHRKYVLQNPVRWSLQVDE